MEFNRGNAEGEVPHATYYGRLLAGEPARNPHERPPLRLSIAAVRGAQRNPELAGCLSKAASPGQSSKAVAAVIRQLLGRQGTQKT